MVPNIISYVVRAFLLNYRRDAWLGQSMHISANDSGLFQPAFPVYSGHLFRFRPLPCSRGQFLLPRNTQEDVLPVLRDSFGLQ